VTSYRFDEIRRALRDYWGLSLVRGGADRAYENYRRFSSLAAVVRMFELERPIAKLRST
jgi:hypothetical protein